MKNFALCFLLLRKTLVSAWILPQHRCSQRKVQKLDMAAVGIFYGTSTGNTQTAADLIYEAFGSDVAAEPLDVDELEKGQLAQVLAEHDALVVGTPTWNTGAETQRSGTGWDDLYYEALPDVKNVLEGKSVAVFGLGDQVSYAENYADATGELFDVFESLGCKMLGSWSMDGYEHEDSKSIRGDKFCGLLLDMVNQEELSQERVEAWVDQLRKEGVLEGSTSTVVVPVVPSGVNGETSTNEKAAKEHQELDVNSNLLDQSIGVHSVGFTPHYNPSTKRTMWVSPDGRKSYVTADPPMQQIRLTP